MMFRGDHQDGHGTGPTGSLSGHMDDWADLAVDFVDGHLDPTTEAAVERHLQGCPACTARLQTQRGVLAFLQDAPLEDPPFELEDQVLGELLFASRPTRAPVRRLLEEPSRWSLLWRRKIRPWVPATVGVAAVLLAVAGYGLLRSDVQDTVQLESTTSVAFSNAEAATDSRDDQTVGAVLTTAAPATTVAALGAETTTTAGAATTTSEADASTVKAAGGVTQDRRTMIANLEDAEAPAYFVFEAAEAGDEGSAKEAAAAAAQQITALTGLTPLDSTLSFDGPTFAAFVPRDDAAQLVDLLRSIGASLQLVVGLGMEPPDTTADPAARLMGRKSEFPELLAHRAPQPAVLNWSFTTSTLVDPADGAGDGTGWVPPDQAGTHVLVVIYLRD